MAESTPKHRSQLRAVLAAGFCVFWGWSAGCGQPVVATPEVLPPVGTTEGEPVLLTPADTAAADPPAGPWLVVAGPDGLWAFDPAAGSATHPETRVPLAPQDSTAMPATAGGRLAYITGRDGIEDLALNVLEVASGRIDSIALIPPENMPAAGAAPGDPQADAVRAIFERTSIAWSPDGGRLAFVGLLEAGNADLYVVELAELAKPADQRSIERLTGAATQEVQPVWSPDGEWVVYAAVEGFGAGAGMVLEGVRAVRPDGTGDRLLYEVGASGGETWVGWTDARTLVVHSWAPGCGNERLRAVDLERGETDELWPGPFNGAALDPLSGTLLVAVDVFAANCGGREPGLYLIGPGAEPARVIEVEAFLPTWAPAAGLFFARTAGELLSVDLDGRVMVVDAPAPVLPSAGVGGGLAWAVGAGIWVGAIGEAPVLVFEGNAALPAWGPDGEALYFLGEAGVYRVEGGEVELVGEGITGAVGFWVTR